MSKSATELALIQGQLAALLDEAPETRKAMRHLAYVEHALTHQGLRALEWLPIEVLQRALDQFEKRVTNWSPVGLATLRSKMAVAIIERTPIRGEPLPEPVRATTPLEHGDDEHDTDSALEAVYAAMGVAAPPKAAGTAASEAPQGAANRTMAATAQQDSSPGPCSGSRRTLPSLDLVPT